MRQRRQAADAPRPANEDRAARSAPDRRVAERAGRVHTRAQRARAGARRRPPDYLRGRARRALGTRRDAGSDAGAFPRLEPGQLRSTRGRGVPARDSYRPETRRFLPAGRRPGQARTARSACVRRPARRHRRLQPQPARADQSGAGRHVRSRRVHAPSAVERGGVARGDAPDVPAASHGPGGSDRAGIHHRGRRIDLDRELVQVRAPRPATHARSRRLLAGVALD